MAALLGPGIALWSAFPAVLLISGFLIVRRRLYLRRRHRVERRRDEHGVWRWEVTRRAEG